jgi:hypothetical protein
MARSQQIWNSFSAGALSPRLLLRTDSDRYQKALQECKNFLITPQGSLRSRQGYEFIRPASVIGSPNRIFAFQAGGNESDMLVEVTAGDGLIHYYRDGSPLPDTTAHNFTQSELNDLYFVNQEKLAVILHPDHPPYYIEIALDGSITGEELPVELIPEIDYQDSDSPTAEPTRSDTYTITFEDDPGNTWLPSKPWILRYGGVFATTARGKVRSWDYTANSTDLIGRLNNALSRIPEINGPDTSYAIVPVGTPNATNVYDLTITGVNAGKLLEMFPLIREQERWVAIENELEEGDVTEPAWSYPTYVLHNGNYYQCIKTNVPDATNEPGVGASWMTYWTDLGATKPDTFDWQYPSGNVWVADAPGARKVYTPGNRGFPTVAVIHQQRLILMANPAASMGVFGSRIGAYKEWGLGPDDADPFFFEIDSTDTPTIKWAAAQRDLILGTSAGDYVITFRVTLSPSDIQAQKQNNARSHAAKAVTFNTDVIYIEQGKQKMRVTTYSELAKAQESTDITQLSENLLHRPVNRLALMQTPSPVVFALREDRTGRGEVIAFSIAQLDNSGAWFEFVCQGDIVDIAVLYSTINDEDELWATISYDGGTTYGIEKMKYPAREVDDDILIFQGISHLDGYVTGIIIQSDENVITGLEQFEGLVVAVTISDAFAGEYLVESGTVVLDAPETEENWDGLYVVGFLYTATAKTFPMATGNQRGTALGTKRRWNRIWFNLLDSALPTINGVLPPDRTPSTNMGWAEIVRVGLREYQVRDLGWDDGAITIVQDRPYPTHLIGFYGEYSSNNA